MHLFFMKLKGFTLAEVLITLGIIGVVAVVTIPTIVKNVEKEQLKTAFKKSYANLVNVYNELTYENGGTPYDCYYGPTTHNTECSAMFKLLKEKLKVIKTEAGPVDGVNIPKFLTRTQVIDQGGIAPNDSCSGTLTASREVWVLSDGSMLISYGTKLASAIALVILDVNGMKKPNRWGYDLYMLNFRNEITNGYKMKIEDQVCFTVEKDGFRINDILLNK